MLVESSLIHKHSTLVQNCFEYFPTSLSTKAVAMVAHGLNMKPLGMLAIVQWLNKQGVDVYLVKLSGHHAHSVPIQHVTYTLWAAEMLHVYTTAKAASAQRGVPLFFVGFSLGALLGQALQISLHDASTFNKQILLAPATAVRNSGYVLKLFHFIYNKMMLPSFTPNPFRANKFLPLIAYQILFENERNIVAARCRKLNIPSLVFIDPKDELISYKKLVNFINQFGLTDHQLVPLNSNLAIRQAKYHHLIVSEETMGKQNWEMATQRMAQFLFVAE